MRNLVKVVCVVFVLVIVFASSSCSLLGLSGADHPLDIVVSNTGLLWEDADTPYVFFDLDVGTNDRTVLGRVYLVSVNDGTGVFQSNIVLDSLDEQKHIRGLYIGGQVALDIIERLTSDATKQYEVASNRYDSARNKLDRLDEKEEEAYFDWQTGRSDAPSLSTIRNWEDERKRLQSAVKEAGRGLEVARENLQSVRVNIQVPGSVILPYITVVEQSDG